MHSVLVPCDANSFCNGLFKKCGTSRAAHIYLHCIQMRYDLPYTVLKFTFRSLKLARSYIGSLAIQHQFIIVTRLYLSDQDACLCSPHTRISRRPHHIYTCWPICVSAMGKYYISCNQSAAHIPYTIVNSATMCGCWRRTM